MANVSTMFPAGGDQINLGAMTQEFYGPYGTMNASGRAQSDYASLLALPEDPRGIPDMTNANRWVSGFSYPFHFEGRSTVYGEYVIGLAEKDDFYTSPEYGLPWVYAETMQIQWSVYLFDDALLDIEPEQSISRYQRSAWHGGSATLMRRGKMLRLESMFFHTPTGQRHYVRQLQQLQNTIQNTANHDMLNTLMGTRSPYLEWFNRQNVDGKPLKIIAQQFANQFACFQKSPQAVKNLFIRAKKIQRDRQADAPNVFIVGQLAAWFFRGGADKLSYEKSGPEANERLNTDPYSITTVEGIKVMYTKLVENWFGELSLPLLSRNRVNGEFYKAQSHSIASYRTPEYVTAWRNILVHEMPGDSLGTIEFTDIVNKTLMYDDGGYVMGTHPEEPPNNNNGGGDGPPNHPGAGYFNGKQLSKYIPSDRTIQKGYLLDMFQSVLEPSQMASSFIELHPEVLKTEVIREIALKIKAKGLKTNLKQFLAPELQKKAEFIQKLKEMGYTTSFNGLNDSEMKMMTEANKYKFNKDFLNKRNFTSDNKEVDLRRQTEEEEVNRLEEEIRKNEEEMRKNEEELRKKNMFEPKISELSPKDSTGYSRNLNMNDAKGPLGDILKQMNNADKIKVFPSESYNWDYFETLKVTETNIDNIILSFDNYNLSHEYLIKSGIKNFFNNKEFVVSKQQNLNGNHLYRLIDPNLTEVNKAYDYTGTLTDEGKKRYNFLKKAFTANLKLEIGKKYTFVALKSPEVNETNSINELNNENPANSSILSISDKHTQIQSLLSNDQLNEYNKLYNEPPQHQLIQHNINTFKNNLVNFTYDKISSKNADDLNKAIEKLHELSSGQTRSIGNALKTINQYTSNVSTSIPTQSIPKIAAKVSFNNQEETYQQPKLVDADELYTNEFKAYDIKTGEEIFEHPKIYDTSSYIDRLQLENDIYIANCRNHKHSSSLSVGAKFSFELSGKEKVFEISKFLDFSLRRLSKLVSSDDELNECIEAFLHCTFHKDFFNFLCDNNIPFPFDFIVARPWQSWRTATGILYRGGLQTGGLFWMNPNWMWNTDSNTKTHSAHFHVYMKAVVTKSQNVLPLEDLYITGYTGGRNLEFYTQEELQDLVENGFVPEDSEYRSSIVAWPVPYRSGTKSPICTLSGYFDSKEKESPALRHFLTNHHVLENMGMGDGLFGSSSHVAPPVPNPYLSPQFYDDGRESLMYNSVIIQGHQFGFHIPTKEYKAVISGKFSHIGKNVYDGMMSQLLMVDLPTYGDPVLKEMPYEDVAKYPLLETL